MMIAAAAVAAAAVVGVVGVEFTAKVRISELFTRGSSLLSATSV